MENIIRIKRATFYGYHGVFKQEQNIGGKFEADVDIYTDFTDAVKDDSLEKTIDYEAVYKLIVNISSKKKYYLIEAFASAIVSEIFNQFSRAKKVAVRVRKNNPPIGGVVDSVEVEIIKERNEVSE